MFRNPSVSDMPNIRPGSILQDINVTLSDFYNQTVLTISGTNVYLESSNLMCRLQGRTSAVTSSGNAKFNDLILSCQPGKNSITTIIYQLNVETCNNFFIGSFTLVKFTYISSVEVGQATTNAQYLGS